MVLEPVKNFINSFKKSSEDRDAQLKRFGVDTIDDKKLANRIELIENLSKQIRDRSASIVTRVDLVEEMVRLAGSAWGRGGTNPIFAVISRYWEELLAQWQPYATIYLASEKGNRNLEDITSLTSRRIMDLITDFGEINVIWYGKLIMDVTMNDKDVSPAYIALIQGAMPERHDMTRESRIR